MSKKHIVLWILFSLILAFFISPFASSSPDGLEKVAEDRGFLEKGEIKPVFTSPIPDYTWPGIDNESFATGLAGIFGTLIVFGVAYGMAVIIKR
ncbi:MAG: PDGLE domain-containing protein [Candidatus Omnitrophica bacterium]|nr:PDGLE domain-containing protein [Candidatus Omnitrophota bacterium]MBU1852612.1 PDGLE domain-containing protein [Candidatus Omnitrophota bacterium]